MSPPKSKIWIYFKKIDKNTVSCKSCSKSLKTSGNTTNIKKHLKVHGIEITEPNAPTPAQRPRVQMGRTGQAAAATASSSSASTSGMSNRTVPHTIPTTVSQSQDDADDDDDSISMVSEISETETSSSVIEQTSTPRRTEYTLSKQSSKSNVKTTPQQPQISTMFNTMSSFTHGGTQHTNLTNAVVYYVCADNRPFAAVEGRDSDIS
ncbi:hypothetical protein HHI36_013816 [Cryptolaemus montrouzieri]|uniref:BED-type domain-containing protein n=1 Tax=Cryptolaemus montrouzieri TaxID=559131 RepID=A0ABD2NIG5_9CUCU